MDNKFHDLLKQVLGQNDFEVILNWLMDSDFFTAPASTKYHGSHEGGLAEHSFKVYELLKKKNECYDLGLTKREVVVAGLLHDVCKIDFYKKEKRWRKTDGQWESYEVWGIKDKEPLGHGEKSVILLQQLIKLSETAIFLIRWHMGPFSSLTGSSGVPLAYYDAVRKCPAIVAMFTADYESSTFLEE